MSFRGLNWQTWTMRFLGGLNQKSDPRALEPPELTICKDVQFDKIGGLQTRYPFALQAGPLDIFGGGAIAGADVRRVVRNGNELLLFTKSKLYSRNVQLQKWVDKGTHLAAKLRELSRFVNVSDQVDCDRAELNNTIVYSWTELGAAATYIAAIDKTTDNVLLAPTKINNSTLRLRVTALATKILLTLPDAGDLYCYALDPADPAAALAGARTLLVAGYSNAGYDVVKVAGADQAVFATRRNAGDPTDRYTVGTVTAGLVVASAVKVRACDGPIAVACTPNGASVQVVRANGANIQGDLITIATLADTAHINKAVGTVPALAPVNQIAAAHRSVQDGGQNRCYVFWSYSEAADSTGVTFGTKSNWVDTGGALGAEADFIDHTGVASRAFDHDGRVYVWITFALASLTTLNGGNTPQVFGQLQNTYFLYRDDAFLVAKAAPQIGGGYAASTGQLGGVANVGANQYAWCGVERRALALGGKLVGYSARAPRDVVVEFDSNEARRCARLGETMFITGGEILQYDGTRLTELGFHIFPWQLDLIDFGAGALEAGTYAYQGSWRSDNARGERERSASATAGQIVLGAGHKASIVPWCNLNITHKTDRPPAAELWRTSKDPTEDAPFYLVTSPDPTALAGDNRYIPTDASSMALAALQDNFADATLRTKEAHPENGGVVKNLAPPAATLILATDTRLFLAGVSGDPHRVLYSKYRGANQVPSFFGTFAVDIPQAGGDITGIAILNETVVVFRKTATYALDGAGFDNNGGGNNYVARRVPGEVGALNHESIAVDERGIVFKSAKGWKRLNHGWAVEDIGSAIVDYNNETVLAATVVESQHQVRVLTTARMLVLDTLASELLGHPMWSEWSIADGVHACMWNGDQVYLAATGVKAQQAAYANVDYGLDVELAPVKLNDLQGYGSIDYFELLGEFRSNCDVRVRLARDYNKDGAGVYFQDKTHTPALAVGKPLQVRHSPSIKQVQSLVVRITVNPTGAGESIRLTGLSFLLGIEPGLNRNIAQVAKQ